MNTQNAHPSIEQKAPRLHDRSLIGIILVVLGLLALASQVTVLNWLGMWMLPLLGLIFLGWGLYERRFAFIIPGGILSGIGLGTLLITGPFQYLSDEARGGLFLLVFALGWVVISLLSLVVDHHFAWWPLVPGVIIGTVGAAVMIGGGALQVLVYLGYVWPVILVAAGLYLILRRRSMTQ